MLSVSAFYAPQTQQTKCKQCKCSRRRDSGVRQIDAGYALAACIQLRAEKSAPAGIQQLNVIEVSLCAAAVSSIDGDAIELCEKERDYVSRELLEDILEYEEDHVDWIETQQSLIQNIGIENYLQSTIED